MADLESIRREIEKKEVVLKQLEGVYKTSSNTIQKKRVADEIRSLKRQINKLLEMIGELKVSRDVHHIETSSHNSDDYSILQKITVSAHRKDHHDREMDTLISYMNFFEENYLPILSEYYIKLDFNHSMRRDTYYIRFMDIKKILKEYDYELDIFMDEKYNTIAIHRDKTIIHKIRHQYMLAMDNFFKDLRDFLKTIIDEYKSGGNIILNPDDRIDLNEFKKNGVLNGYTVLKAVEEIYKFSDEIIRFLSIPSV